MDVEVEKVPVSSGEKEDILSNTEITQFFFQKYFSSNPETDVEKTITAEELLRITKSYYDKCHELGKRIMDGSTTVQKARKELQWYRVLKSNFTIQDLTFVAETFLLEYEMSAKDENQSFLNIEDIKEMSHKKKTSDEEMKVDISEDVRNPKTISAAKVESGSQDHTSSRKPEECTESLLALYHLADVIESNILESRKAFKTTDEADSKNTGGKGNVKKSEEKMLEAASSREKIASQRASAENISRDRLEFIRTLKVMIRATLMLFKRMNPEWVQQAEKVIEKSRPMMNKRKLLLQGKSISIESSSMENPPSASSIASSSSNFEVPSKPEISNQSSKDTMEVDA